MAIVLNVRNVIVSIIFVFLSICSVNSEICTKSGPCSCVFDNGMHIDLSKIDNVFYSASKSEIIQPPSQSGWKMIHYYFHPCTNGKLTFNDTTNNCLSSSLCVRTINMVQNNGTYIMQENKYDTIGDVSNVGFSGVQKEPTMLFRHGTINSAIMLICVATEENTLTIADSDPFKPILYFYSPLACPIASNHHSFGTTLLIIFFVIALVYLVCGVLVKHFLMGAQGVEVVPNIAFWSNLPGLVKDGVAFTANGFKPPAQFPSSAPGQSPNPNSYDSI